MGSQNISNLTLLIVLGITSCNQETESQQRNKSQPPINNSGNQTKKTETSEDVESPSGSSTDSNEFESDISNEETTSDNDTKSSDDNTDNSNENEGSSYVSDPFFEKLTENYCSITFLKDTETTILELSDNFKFNFKKDDKLLVSYYRFSEVGVLFRIQSGVISFKIPKPEDASIESSNCNINGTYDAEDQVGVAFENFESFEDTEYTKLSCMLKQGDTFKIESVYTTPFGNSGVMYNVNLGINSHPECPDTLYYVTENTLFEGRSFPVVKARSLRLK